MLRQTARRSIAQGRPRFGIRSPADQLRRVCSSCEYGQRKQRARRILQIVLNDLQSLAPLLNLAAQQVRSSPDNLNILLIKNTQYGFLANSQCYGRYNVLCDPTHTIKSTANAVMRRRNWSTGVLPHEDGSTAPSAIVLLLSTLSPYPCSVLR